MVCNAMTVYLPSSPVALKRTSSPTSIRELADAEWIMTSITYKAEEEGGPLFAQHGLGPSKLVMKLHSALSFLICTAHSRPAEDASDPVDTVAAADVVDPTN